LDSPRPPSREASDHESSSDKEKTEPKPKKRKLHTQEKNLPPDEVYLYCEKCTFVKTVPPAFKDMLRRAKGTASCYINQMFATPKACRVHNSFKRMKIDIKDHYKHPPYKGLTNKWIEKKAYLLPEDIQGQEVQKIDVKYLLIRSLDNSLFYSTTGALLLLLSFLANGNHEQPGQVKLYQMAFDSIVEIIFAVMHSPHSG
jgi:hypothetical protein